MRYLEGPRPRIFGHRGASGDAPENTIESFRLALEQGADLADHPLARGERVRVGVEQLRAQLADQLEVEPVLDLGERVAERLRRGAVAAAQAFLEVHQPFLLPSRRCGLPSLAGPM